MCNVLGVCVRSCIFVSIGAGWGHNGAMQV